MSETVGRGCVNVHAVIKCEPDLPVAVEHQPADIVARNARPVAIGMGVTAELTAVETAQSVVGSERCHRRDWMTGRHPQYSYADYDKQRRSPIRHAPAETRYRVETKMQQYSGKFVS